VQRIAILARDTKCVPPIIREKAGAVWTLLGFLLAIVAVWKQSWQIVVIVLLILLMYIINIFNDLGHPDRLRVASMSDNVVRGILRQPTQLGH
jgi:hypothetical protein